MTAPLDYTYNLRWEMPPQLPYEPVIEQIKVTADSREEADTIANGRAGAKQFNCRAEFLGAHPREGKR